MQFFLPALALIFITLKLTGHVTWSWLWVTAPLWGGLAVFFTVIGAMFVFNILKAILEKSGN